MCGSFFYAQFLGYLTDNFYLWRVIHIRSQPRFRFLLCSRFWKNKNTTTPLHE